MPTTVHDLCKEIPQLDEHGKFDVQKHNKGEKVPTVAAGMTPKRASVREGIYRFSPEELLSLHIPTVSVNGMVKGYQRPFVRDHARKIAVALLGGKALPEITVAVDGNGVMSAVDGQHRAVGGVIAGVPIVGIVRRMSKDEQKQLFTDQRKAKPVDRNVLILAGTNPYERYIQRGVSHNGHAWREIVSSNSGSKTRISPFAMFQLLCCYVGTANGTTFSAAMEERWDEDLADELAPLVSCFSDKQTNPAAFQATALRGIGAASMYIFRRNPHLQESDYQRWITHMPKFPWERYMHVRSGADWTFHLVQHWNKRLHESRRVQLP
jgi:hypothetical protein